MVYNKPTLTLDEQIGKLQSHGFVIEQTDVAKAWLSRVGYYRLSAYWYPYKTQIESIHGNRVNFNTIIALYEFDRQLRLLILDGIERIEVQIRAAISSTLTTNHGAFAHVSQCNFHPKFNHSTFLTKLNTEVSRSRETFIQHYKSTYNGFPTLPLWMSTEVMSLGSLSFFYKGLLADDKRVIAKQFNIPHKRLEIWLHTLTYVRNLCAHHCRLWNRQLAIKPENNVKDPNWCAPLTPDNRRIFYFLLMLRHLLRCTEPTNEWLLKCELLLIPHANDVFKRKSMGMPENWQQHPLWK